MKKIVLFLLIFNVAFANISCKSYEKYVKEMSNYSLNLEPISYNPFYVPKVKKEVHKVIKSKPKIKILAVLNNKVLLNLKIKRKSRKKWLKIGDSINGYKLIKITKDAVVFKYKNKIEIFKMNSNNFKLRVLE
jgi:hypothetical protein